MKTIIISAIVSLTALSLNAQVVLEHTYNYSAAIVKLESLGYKYYIMDVPNAQCRIYNLDHSLFKTINCPVPTGYYLSDVKLVSEKLFNVDSNIELAYTFYKYVPTQTSYYYIYGSRVINESGSILVNIDGAAYIYANKTGENTYKLFAYCYDYSVSPEKVWTNIYSLPGVPVVALVMKDNTSEFWAKAYPNPANDFIKIEYQLPAKVNQGVLHLLDNQGKQISQFIIDSHTDHLSLETSGLSKGVYHYFIEYQNIRTRSEMIVVQ